MVYPSGSANNNSSGSNSTNSSTGNGNSANISVASANSTNISPLSSGITTPTRISIKEANDHLQLLHSRVSELEEIIRSQSDQSAEQEKIYRRQLKELKSAKEAQIDELTKTIVRLEERLKDLESSIKQKNEKLEENQTRLTQVDQLNHFLPNLEKLIVSLKQVTLSEEEDVITPISNKELTLSNSPSLGFSSQLDIGNNNSTSNDIDNDDCNEKNSDNLDHGLGDGKQTDECNDTSPSLIDMACQTDISGVGGGLIKSDLLNGEKSSSEINTNDLIRVSGISTIGGLCSSSEPCFSRRSSIDETNHKEKPGRGETRKITASINEDGMDPVWNSDKQIVRNTRSNRSRRLRKSSSSTVNYPHPTSINREKDYYCPPSLTNPVFGPGRAIGYRINSNGSSSHLSGKVERSFSITSNFSEDEDLPPIKLINHLNSSFDILS